MIHTIHITPSMSVEELRKLFRKKLMTGGAVIHLAPGLSADELILIYERHSASVQRHNVSAMVLAELAKDPLLPESLVPKLQDLGIVEIDRNLKIRPARNPG